MLFSKSFDFAVGQLSLVLKQQDKQLGSPKRFMLSNIPNIISSYPFL